MKLRSAISFALLLFFGTLQVSFGQMKIAGKVKSKGSGESLNGATIIVKGTDIGTGTDSKGEFELSVTQNSGVLTISYAGMKSQDVKFNEKTKFIDVVLDELTGNEVVVVGYGSKKRKDLSTAVSSISSKDITSTPTADAAQALQGKVSGVTIVQNSGAPGGTGGTRIRIRGISSINGTNNPLIVVDGYPLPDQNADNILNSFGTGDIESIDVLKDAAAASIYGQRASNGVIMITTKRGKPGRVNLNVDIYRGIQQAWQLPSMLNAKEYAIMNSEARIASGMSTIPKLSDYNAVEAQYGQGTDWLKEVFRRAAMQSVNITATGGSDKAQYLFSAGYFLQDGIIYKTDVERFNLRFNGDVKVNDRIKIGNSISMNKFTEHSADTYSPFNSVILLGLMAPPTVAPRNEDGTYAGGNGSVDGFSEPNPIYQLEVPKNQYTKYRFNGNVFTEITLLKQFKFKALFGADYNYQEINNFSPATPASGGNVFNLTNYSVQKGLYPDFLAEYTLAYDKTFLQKHKLNAIAGYTFQENKYSYVVAGRGGTFTQNIPVLNNQVFLPTDVSQTYNAAEDGINKRAVSYFARVNYDFDNRGYFGFSIRRDGTSNFAPGKKFATFPSISAAWRLSQEPFMKNVKWIDELKVRGSFGYTGNPDVTGNAYIQSINQSFQYTFGNSNGSGGIVSAAAPSRTYNPNIKWEKNEQINLGVDATAFDTKINLALDVYQRRSIDLILYVAPPLVSGTYESVPFNTGIMQNRGIDLTLNAKILKTNHFSWSSNAVVGTYKNKIASMGLSATIDNGFSRITGGSKRIEEGFPVDYFYGFVTEGIFQSYDEIRNHAVQTAGTDPTTSTAPGDIKFKDLNADGIINDKDRTNIGNFNPTFTYGLTQSINYKNIELTLFIQGSQGNKVLNFTRWYTEGGVSNGNYSREVLGRWTGQGTSNEMPRMIMNDPNGNNRVSDRFVEDGSYLRVKNVRVAYSAPAKWVSKMGVKKAQLYVSAQNLLTFTNYTGMDPEVGGGVDIGFYPQSRTFIAGATIDF